MAMSAELLTARTQELAANHEALRLELVRRAQEHQEMHTQLQAANDRIGELEDSVDRQTRPLIGEGMRAPNSRSGLMNTEAIKRLDRWATTPPSRPYAGDSTVGLTEWMESIKEGAGYCSDVLQTAMEKMERYPE